MGRPKALLTLDGETFVERLVRLFAAAGCHPIGVVVGADAAAIAPAVPRGALTITAADWSRGMRASLAAGLQAVPEGDVIVTHVDRPRVAPSTLTALCALRADRPIIACHAGRPGHPVRLPASLCRRLLRTDEAPLSVILGGEDPRRLEVFDPGVTLNVNTPGDYVTLTRGSATPPCAAPE